MQWGAASVGTSWLEGSVRELPVPWPSLGRVVRPRGGQQIMLLAAPGVGKTMFALNWAALSGAHTLYVSADTDAKLMSSQLACLATGHDREQVEGRLQKDAMWRRAYAESVLKEYPRLVLDFSPAPHMAAVVERAEALCQVWGVPPELIVLDTASDIQKPHEDFTAWRETWLACRDLARIMNCVVMIAHHVRQGPAANGDIAPQQGDGQYKADQFAEIVLGLHRSGMNMVATPQKNRGGKSRVPVKLRPEYERALIRELSAKERADETPTPPKETIKPTQGLSGELRTLAGMGAES